MTSSKKIFLIAGSCLAFIVLFSSPPVARGDQKVAYEVKASSAAVNGDYVRAREKAVAQAMRLAVEYFLRDLLGEDTYSSHEGTLKKVVVEGERYVRSYRYLSVDDSVRAETSQVELEVTLFADALQRKLGALGVIAIQAPTGARTVVALINEKSLFADNAEPFWNKKPISEGLLVKSFVAAGIKVVSRESIRSLIKEETVMRAAKGDVGAAIDIGQKAGADVVVVGNAMSSLLDEGGAQNPVQVSVSLKAISSLKARVVAAKSDSMAVKKPLQADAEAEAFDKVSKKLGDFFVASIQRFWIPGASAAQTEPQASPSTSASPPSTDDL